MTDTSQTFGSFSYSPQNSGSYVNDVFTPATNVSQYNNIEESGNATQINIGDAVNFDYAVNQSAAPDSATYLGYYLDGGGVQHPFILDSSNNYILLGESTGQSYNITRAAYTQGLVTCFASGTSIETAFGNAAVEDLRVGDQIVAASGALRPIRWLGHRTVDCRPNPAATRPVLISAHAFGENRPTRDLYVSPGHAICVDILGEVLIPAGLLVNGSTIVQVAVDEVTYWHVELESHDVILAEGLPAESYLDMGNRGFFREADVVDLAAGPDAPVVTHADFCRPYVDGGPVLDAVRAQLAARAAAVVVGKERQAAA